MYEAINVCFYPIESMSYASWYVLYPLLLITALYLIYLKKNSRFHIHRLKENLIKNSMMSHIRKPGKLHLKLIGPITLFMLPAMVVFILGLYIGLAGDYLANEHVVKEVVVNHVNCVTGKYRTYLALDVTDANQKRYTVNHYVDTCKNYQNAARLDKRAIQLIGRQWYLGFYYDEFRYPIDIVLS